MIMNWPPAPSGLVLFQFLSPLTEFQPHQPSCSYLVKLNVLSVWNILPQISAWLISFPVVAVQSLSAVWLFVIPETAACQASLSFTKGLGNLFSSWFWFSDEMGGGLLSAGSDSKESACKVEDLGSIPGLGRFSGEGNGNPLQYSCLENPMDRGAWWSTVLEVPKSQTQLSD